MRPVPFGRRLRWRNVRLRLVRNPSGPWSPPRSHPPHARPFLGPCGPGMARLEIAAFKEKSVRQQSTLRRRSTAMQIVVAPEATSVAARSDARLTREICGVGLLERTLVTAQRAGASEVLLVWPQSLSRRTSLAPA